MSKVKDIIKKMTLEEKASMCSGKSFWHLEGIEHLGIPSTMVTDGPHGLRKQSDAADHLGINESIVAVCYPSAVGTASSFNKEMIYEMGEYLGTEAQAENVSVILGPGVNIKRSPLCGRNFEYFSEDPFVAAEMSTALIKGVQSKNVGTSIKHFAVNNQETRRMSASSNLSERALREIYLAAFEKPVKEGKPWTVMSSYNRVNNIFAAENKKLLTDILRDEWGFEGYTVTDWGGINDRVKGLEAGQDLEMPSSDGMNDKKIVKAVQDGTLSESILDTAVERILNIIFKYTDNRDETAVFNRELHHEKAVKIAEESMVLLKNNGILPLDKSKNIAFIGEFAEKPRYQGSGSSHINASKVVGALEAVKNVCEITYAAGFSNKSDQIDQKLHNEAVEVAKKADTVVVFAGLPDAYESEGFDRTHMNLPPAQNELIKDILAVQKNVVVVLQNGSPILMPWINEVNAVLESYLGGQGVGEAQVSILFGDVNPSGKLAETFPNKVEDNPSYLNFPGYENNVDYCEDIFVGYRYYDTKKMDVLFPFGYGLSYTNFEYSNLKISNTDLKPGDKTTVTVTVKNTGTVEGKEIVQLYIHHINSPITKAEKELKGFSKVNLKPNEEKTVEFELCKRDFSFFDQVKTNNWRVLSGEYEILIGKSSRDIVLKETIKWTVPLLKGFRVDDNTLIGELMEHPATKPVVDMVIAQAMQSEELSSMANSDMLGGAGQAMMDNLMKFMPIRAIVNMAGSAMSAQVPMLMGALNGALEEYDKNN